MTKYKFAKFLLVAVILMTPLMSVKAYSIDNNHATSLLRRGFIIQVDEKIPYKNGYVLIKGRYELNGNTAYNADISVTGHDGAKVGAYAIVPEGNRVRVSFSVSYDNSVDYYDIYV